MYRTQSVASKLGIIIPFDFCSTGIPSKRSILTFAAYQVTLVKWTSRVICIPTIFYGNSKFLFSSIFSSNEFPITISNCYRAKQRSFLVENANETNKHRSIIVSFEKKSRKWHNYEVTKENSSCSIDYFTPHVRVAILVVLGNLFCVHVWV